MAWAPPFPVEGGAFLLRFLLFLVFCNCHAFLFMV